MKTHCRYNIKINHHNRAQYSKVVGLKWLLLLFALVSPVFFLIADKNGAGTSVECSRSSHQHCCSDHKNKKQQRQKRFPGDEILDTMELEVEFYQYLVNLVQNSPYPGVENYTIYKSNIMALEPLTNAESLRPDFGPVINDVTSFHYVKNVHRCTFNNTKKSSSKIFIAIHSAPENGNQREAIRMTWLDGLNDPEIIGSMSIVAGYAFYVGKSSNNSIQKDLDNESRIYRDIIQVQVDSTDSTLMAVSLLYWLNRYCSGAQFIFKVDDDIFINVRNLDLTIKKLTSFKLSSELFIFGLKMTNPSLRGKRSLYILFRHSSLYGPVIYIVPSIYMPDTVMMH